MTAQPKLDIASWEDGAAEYHRQFQAMVHATPDAPAIRKEQHRLRVDVPSLYALLTLYISEKPNGLMTMVGKGKPLDNLVWWDFALKSEAVLVHIKRTSNHLEGDVYISDPTQQFDLPAFLEKNIRKHSKKIHDQLKRFEKHTIFVNHYHSYSTCADWLRDEIGSIDISLPKSPQTHFFRSKEEAEGYTKDILRFITNSRRFHVLAKSLVLHSAFMAEAALNMMLRIGAAPPLRVSKAAMSMCTRANFDEKLRVLKVFTVILSSEVDLKAPAIADAKKVMELRNKYVHADETSEHNRVGEVLYDDDFPLIPDTGNAAPVDNAIRNFHQPSREQAFKAHDDAKAFVEYLLALVHPNYKKVMNDFFEQQSLSYNETRKMYSGVFNENAPMFAVMPGDPDDKPPGENPA